VGQLTSPPGSAPATYSNLYAAIEYLLTTNLIGDSG